MLTIPTNTTQAPELRQLRHHTKNALQRILLQVERCRELQATVDGRRLVADIERRIRLSSSVSDALFGLVSTPGRLEDRLRRLAEAVAELLGDPDQFVRVDVAVDPATPPGLDDVLLRIANEYLGNAVKHGLYARCAGFLLVRVDSLAGGAVRLRVTDDGWGFRCAPEQGEGLRLARILSARYGGTVGLACRGGLTVAEAVLKPG